MENRNTAPVGVFDSGVGGLRIFRGYSESSIRKQIAEYDYPLFGTDHPFSENKGRQGNRDRLQYGECACA